MRLSLNLRTILGAGLALAIGLGGGQSAMARGSCHTCQYVKVVTYRTEVEPYVKWVEIIDEYGCVHRVKKLYYRTIQVPVVNWVKVSH